MVAAGWTAPAAVSVPSRPCLSGGGGQPPAARGAGVTVAVVDTGAAPIPQLKNAVWWSASKSFVSTGGVSDSNGHGTEMAAIVHEVAPGARLLVVQALDDSGGGSSDDVARAIRYAVAKGARVVNVSAAGGAADPAIRSAIVDAGEHGALVVVAAGNDGTDVDTYSSFPAGYRLPNLVVVAATNGHGALSATSDWGEHTVQIGAPGVDVPTLSASGTAARVSGSSPAAALTSGVSALVLGQDGGMSVAGLQAALAHGSDPERGLAGKVASGGQLDPHRALGGSTRLSCSVATAFLQ